MTDSAPRGRSLSYVVSVGITLAALGLSRLLFNTVGNRTVGLSTVGSANIALSLALLCGLPVSAGLAMALSRFVPLLDGARQITRAVRLSTLLGIASTLPVLAVTCWAYVRTSVDPPSWSRLALIAAWALIYAQYAIGRSLLFARGAIRRVLALEILGFGLFACALAATFHSPRDWWLPFTLYPLPMAGWSLWQSFSFPSGERTVAERDFLRFAALGLLGSAAGQGIQYGSTLAGAALAGRDGAGLWAILLSVSAPVLLLPRSLSTSYLPRLSALSSTDGNAFAETSREHQRFSGLLALPATIGLMIAGRTFGERLFPAPTAIDPLPIWLTLCVMTFVTCRGEPILTAIAARGKAGINAAAALAGAAMCAAIWLVGYPRAGLLRVAAGLAVYSIAVPLVAAFIARFSLGPLRPRLYAQASDGIALLALPLMVACGESRWVLLATALATAIAAAYDARHLIGSIRRVAP
ncbi:MAG TPA: hypothetical protein VFV19_04365 [Candidatus Polarisedimenticolaceae bacterium]|nr:hypothetical protein [Candidatus Polarisedimenticolaceae bacterium]